MDPIFSPEELAAIRAEFPILDQAVNGHPLVYLDSGATAQRPRAVLEAERDFLETRNAAVHRGAHTLAAEATELFEDARETVAGFLGARSDEIVWTANATTGLNLLAHSLAEADAPFRVGPGDEILVTEREHHANLIPWQQLARRVGARLRYIPIDDDGSLRIEALDELVTARTRVLAFAHVSNVLGTTAPLAELVTRARAVGALVVLDACQSAPHLPLDVTALDVDAAAFSGHKLYGPNGVGVLYGRRELLAALPPMLTGGSMVTTVTMEEAAFLAPPQRFEAGTQPIPQAIGLAAAIRFVTGIGMERIAAHGEQLAAQTADGLAEIPGVRVDRKSVV